MGDCVSGFASSIAKDLVCRAVDELRYPCCFKDLVEDLEREKDKVVETRNNVQQRIVDAKKQTKETARSVHKWLNGADTDIDKAEELLREAWKKTSCCFGKCPNWISRYRVGKQLAERKRTITICNEEGNNYTKIERLSSLPGLAYFPSERCLKFDSRKSAYDQLLMALKGDEVNMIGLYGMGGSGKTTLAIEVGKRATKEKLFNHVIFVTVSSTVEVARIQEEIASSLECELLEKGEMRRAQRLCKRLIQEEKVLVILDNVWQTLDFVAIGIPSSEIHKGCKVLITTRSEEVCIGMDCQRMIPLSVLHDEEAWHLFQIQARIAETTSDNLKHLARLISNECGGLPVLITAVASTLKAKAEVEWKVALERLTSSKPVHIEKGLQNPYKCLQLSYDNLDMKEAKSLLLLCSVFPEEYEIVVEDITRFALGLGLIGEVHSYERARNEVCAAKTKLIRNCLLLDADEGKRVKMHDLIRQVALCIAEDEGTGIKCAMEKDVTMEYTSPRYLWCEKFPYQLDCSNLEFLCINTYLEVSDEIFKGMKKLTVLFLVNKGLEIRPLSTKSFKSLKNLHCLTLEYWELGDISFLGDLKELESLTMCVCSFVELPDVIVAQLPNLRLLDFLECDMERTPFEVIGRYTQLEELYIDDCRLEWDLYDETTDGFFSKFSVPQALQRYRIELGTQFVGYEEKLLNHRKTLLLSCFDTSNAAVKNLTKKAEVLHMVNIQGGAKNIAPDIFQIDGRGMNELIELLISTSKGIEHLVDPGNHLNQVASLFSKLRKLTIYSMEHLRSLYHGLPPSWKLNLCCLQVLQLKSCPKLNSLFTPAIAQSLEHLEKLEIIYCDGLKHILDDDNKEEIIMDDHRFVFPKLKQLIVRECNKVEYIIPVTYAQRLVELKEIEIRETPNLIYVFGHSIYENGDAHSSRQYQNKTQIELPVLEKLALFSIPNMINICPDNYYVTCSSLLRMVMDNVGLSALSVNNLMVHSDNTSTSEIEATSMTNGKFLGSIAIWNSSKMKSIFHLDGHPINRPQATSWLLDLNLINLPELNYIWKGVKHFVTLQNLQLLYIWGCGKLKTIFSSSISRCLPQLEILVVLWCEGLGQIIEDNEEDGSVSNHQSQKICFSKLKLLLVAHCNNLRRLFYLSSSHEFPELKYLIINQDHRIEQVFEGVRERRVGVLLPELKHVILMQLPNLFNVSHWIEFQTLPNLFVHNCPKLSLTSTTTVEDMLRSYHHDKEIDFLVRCDLLYIRDIINKDIAEKDLMPQTTSQLEMNSEDQTSSGSEHNQIESGETKSHEVLNRGTQDSPSLEHNLSSHEFAEGIKETETATIGKVLAPMNPKEATCDSGLARKSTTSLETTLHKTTWRSIEGIIKESVQEGSTSEDATKETLSTSTEGNDFGVVVKTHTELVDQGVKRNEDEMGTRSCQKIHNVDDNIQEGLNLMDEEDTCASHYSLIIAELGAYKHFVGMDDVRISLLKEAIAMYPHLWNVCKKFSKRFQALKLQTLADLLLFLRNESAFSVSPQQVKEFHELCDEVVQLGFERSWVDKMRQRVKDRDPKVDHAQEQLSELLKRQDQLTEELLMVKDEINCLNDFIAAQKECFDFL